MKYYDFRSDTVTQPTDRMREVMANAIVGDDVYEDDPTVKKLEAMSAEILGKEAALFVPSGTFGNQLAILTHTKRGDEVILGHDCHIVMHEVGAAAVISGVQLRQVPTVNGNINPSAVEKMIREKDIHYPDTGLICMENAHSNGTVISVKNMSKIYDVAKKHDIPVHLDGARIFNAAKALDVSPKEIASQTDSVMFCLSKGLCAPVGSILAGSQDFVEKARKMRKLMGGGLRQVGFLAAAGIVALEDMVDHLTVDHENAKYLAERLSEIEKVEVLDSRLDINMVFVKFHKEVDANHFVETLLGKGIKINGPEEGEYRFVTNYWTDRASVDNLVDAIKNYI